MINRNDKILKGVKIAMYHGGFMRSAIVIKYIFIGFMLMSLNPIFSQTTPDSLYKDQTVIIKMNNGDEYSGQIISKDKEKIVLRTVNGELSLIASNVKSIETNEYLGRFRFENPHITRYFFGPTGIPVDEGEGYYQNVLLTTNFVNFGLTKNVSLGGGFEFLSTITGNPIWFFTPKVAFDLSEDVHVGGGVIMLGVAGEGSATLGYGALTLGDADGNVTIGAGFGIRTGRRTFPTLMVSATTRVGNGIALLTENYFIPNSFGNDVYFGIHGIRLLSEKTAFDIGAIIIPEISNDIPAIPFVGYVRAF